MGDYYDIDGTPLSTEEWAVRFGDRKNGDWWVVGRSVVGEWSISTVWLGADHSYGSGPPLIFETMVFGPQPFDEFMERYASWGEAEEGHALIVEMVASYPIYEAR